MSDAPVVPLVRRHAALMYAAALHERIAQRVGCDGDHLEVQIEPLPDDERFALQVLAGPWQGAPACHRYSHDRVTIHDNHQAAGQDLDVIAAAFAKIIIDEHRISNRRLICRPRKKGN